MSPVATTPWRRRSLGTANPVQPTSSSTVVSPAVMPASRMAAWLSAVNIGEVSESAKRTAAASTGAGSSAATYQRAPTRHRSSRESSSRDRRSREEDGQQDARDRGSCSIAAATNGRSASNWLPVPGKPPGPTTRTKPPHEIANVRATNVNTGCLVMKLVDAIMPCFLAALRSLMTVHATRGRSGGREFPAVGHRERGNEEPQRGGQDEVIGQARIPATSSGWRISVLAVRLRA